MQELAPTEDRVVKMEPPDVKRKNAIVLIPESCTKYRCEAPKALCFKRSGSDFDPQAYDLYGEDQHASGGSKS